MQRPPIEQQITFLYVADLAMTAQFYEKLLGLELALDQGTCRIYRTCPGAYIGFCQRQSGAALTSAPPASVILTLVTPQVAEWHAFLSQQGVIFEKAPAFNPQYNIFHCFLRDPDGHLIEIQRFEDPAWRPQP